MACMEHECRQCGRAVFNNEGSGGTCPKCGACDWTSTWDEQLAQGNDALTCEFEDEREHTNAA